jgi:pimeloyl-ACP methyl ester carboxylesterase
MSLDLTPLMRDWRARGSVSDCSGVGVFRIAEGRGAPLVLFHGFPSHSLDWHAVLPLLTPHHRVLCFDFPGYGLSDRPRDYRYSLIDQFEVAERVIGQEGMHEFDLVCHDMGCSVACELFHRLEAGNTPLSLRRVVFLNGSVYMEMARPLPTQRLLRNRLLGPLLARLASRRLFAQQFRSVFARPDLLSVEELDAYWHALTADRRILPRLAGYMNERLQRADRWLPPLTRLEAPALILWGTEDPVAVPAIARRLHAELPHSRLQWLQGVGHYPQLEAPEEVAARIREFLQDPA